MENNSGLYIEIDESSANSSSRIQVFAPDWNNLEDNKLEIVL